MDDKLQRYTRVQVLKAEQPEAYWALVATWLNWWRTVRLSIADGQDEAFEYYEKLFYDGCNDAAISSSYLLGRWKEGLF